MPGKFWFSTVADLQIWSLWDGKAALHSQVSSIGWSFVFLPCVLSGYSSGIACLLLFQCIMTSLWNLVIQRLSALFYFIRVILQISIWARLINVLNRHHITCPVLHPTLPFLARPPQAIPFAPFLSGWHFKQTDICYVYLSSLPSDILKYIWI